MNQPPPQTVIVTTKNTASLTLGIIGLVVGVLSLLVGWVPFLGLVAIPVAVIGLILAGVGILIAVFKGFRGIGMPLLAAGICIAGLIVPLLSTGGTSALISKTVQEAPKRAQTPAAAPKREAPSLVKPSETPAAGPTVARFNLPFTIDGVEIVITGLRIGKLQKIPREFSFGSVPDRPFLLGAVALKNTTEGTIIHLQDVWGHATVTDNFGNVYEPPDSLSLSRSDIQGAISSQALKPGEAVTDLMIFEAPLDNATTFTLSCDPNLFRRTGNQLLQQLSNESFTLEFRRSDIK